MKKNYQITILPSGKKINAFEGETLLTALRRGNLAPSAPCGGNGSCGKCQVFVNNNKLLACQTPVTADMTVQLISSAIESKILTANQTISVPADPLQTGYLLAVDIGTTTIAGYLMNEQGHELAADGIPNPQSSYGADVISRIQLALQAEMSSLTFCIRKGVADLMQNLCEKSGINPLDICIVSIVGNPCMQQLFLGIPPKNLATVPFSPVITTSSVQPASQFLPVNDNALLLTVPDISGFVGADTVSCVLSTRIYDSDAITLMVDIGTNGEMVLGNSSRLVACSTAAGPALEGAKITFGMTVQEGAIDHVFIQNGTLSVHVIGECTAIGICGSGLIDAIACLLELGLLNKRGRLNSNKELHQERIVFLTEDIYLTQNDIREVQLAKGAIAAGILLLASELAISLEQIDTVLLAGAFGSFMNTQNACRIGLIPEELSGKIIPVGNAAGSGAKLIACNQSEFSRTDYLVHKTEFIELANSSAFQHEFAKQMYFKENDHGKMD